MLNLYTMFDWIVSNARVDSQLEAESRCIKTFSFCTCSWIKAGWNLWFAWCTPKFLDRFKYESKVKITEG
jgi:hypothetical protein